MAASLEASAIRDARELQSSCEDILRSGSVEQVSYLFDPPSVVSSLANLNRNALDAMERALVQSGYLPSSSSSSAAPDPPAAASSSRARPSTSFRSNIIVEADHPPIAVAAQSSPAPEVPVEETREEDELSMSGVEESEGNVVGDKGKGVAEDSS